MPSAAQILKNAGTLHLLLEHSQRRFDTVAFAEVYLDHGGLPPNLYHVLRRGTLLALYDVELDFLALGERLEAAALDRRVMYETILGATLRRDETKTLLIVEPLDCADRTHVKTPFDEKMGLRDCEAPVQTPKRAQNAFFRWP